MMNSQRDGHGFCSLLRIGPIYLVLRSLKEPIMSQASVIFTFFFHFPLFWWSKMGGSLSQMRWIHGHAVFDKSERISLQPETR